MPPSLSVAVEFCINFPVVESKRTIALSVDDAGPTTSPPEPVAAMVIAPEALVIVTPVPWVRVDLVNPVPVPMSN